MASVFLPIFLIVFAVVLSIARSMEERHRLLLARLVTGGMVALCLGCGVWLVAIWPLFPQITLSYPGLPAELLAGFVVRGLATLLALVALVRATFALRALSAAPPKPEPLAALAPLLPNQKPCQPAKTASTPHMGKTTVSSPARRDRTNKVWIMVLAVLLVVFIIPWPLLITNTYPNLRYDYPSFGEVLSYWLVVGLVSLIIALAVKIGRRERSRNRSRCNRSTSKAERGATAPR